jgi:hypothetical protein
MNSKRVLLWGQLIRVSFPTTPEQDGKAYLSSWECFISIRDQQLALADIEQPAQPIKWELFSYLP